MQPVREPRPEPAHTGPFPREEFARRLDRVRARMAEAGLDGLLVSRPENIYYLTGLDHQGFFTFHLLVVPASGRLTLVTREMERATVEAQIPETAFTGYRDGTRPETAVRGVIVDQGLASARVGVDKESLCFPPAVYEALLAQLPGIRWSDASLLVDELRLVKSPLEIDYTRRAARVSDAMMQAAIDAARPGVNEQEVAAETHRAMALAGGEYPGFAPFIRPSPRMAQEHTTWQDRQLRSGEALFLEMAGCVARYHAPLGRFLHIGGEPPEAAGIREVCHAAFDRIVEAIRPGVTAAEVYGAWHRYVEASGITGYHRHHCGYLVGLGYPPSWTGGSSVVGLRHDSSLVLRPGMVFHLLSWLLGSARGDFFVSNTAVLTDAGCEVLTRSPA